MAAGTVQPIGPGFELEELRRGALPNIEAASQTFFDGEVLVTDANGRQAIAGAAFTRADFIAFRDGQNGSAGLVTSAYPILPTTRFEFTLLQAFAQNLCLPTTYYGLVRTSYVEPLSGATKYAWIIDTTNNSPHVRIGGIIGAGGDPGALTVGDTYTRVWGYFNPAILAGYAQAAPVSAVTNTITAHSGGGQTNATALTSAINRITTAAALGDSVRLPASTAGLEVEIDNRGAFPIQVFGAGTETINSITTTVGVSQGVNTIVRYTCVVAGNWETHYQGSAKVARVALTTNGAIDPHTAAAYIITKAGVLADTLAAPTTVVDDGIRIEIISNTANAHTLTATGLLGTGSASTDVATFAANLGSGLVLEARGAKWLVVSSVGITFS